VSYLVLTVGVLAGLLVLGKFLMDAEPAKVAKAIRLGGGLALGLAGLVLTLRGLFVVGGPLAFFGLMLFARGLGWQGAPGFGMPGMGGGGRRSRGGASNVKTRYLDMSLDHDSGEMDGTVREGDFRGRRLSELDLSELIELLRAVRLDDADSERLVEAYLDRAHPEWRDGGESDEPGSADGGRDAGGGGGPMSRRDALEILELEEGASDDDVRAAYKRLMKKHHPDQGGSAWYAAKLNQAKDLLLKR
jgi:hypothetical protein